MIHFNSLIQRILEWDKSEENPLRVFGVSSEQWLFIFKNLLNESANLFQKKNILLIFKEQDHAEDAYEHLKNKFNNVFFLPGIESSPYSGIISSEKNYFERMSTLAKIFSMQEKADTFILTTTIEALCFKSPPKNFFKNTSRQISAEDIISPSDLAKLCVELGYSRSSSIEEPATFVQKGQIFDIYPLGGNPVRLSYFDDMIETIHGIDIETQKTLKDEKYSTIKLNASAGLLTKGDYATTLRENIPQISPGFKNKFENRKQLFQKISDGQLFENYPAYIPLFFKDCESAFSLIAHQSSIVPILINTEECIREFTEYLESLRSELDQLETDLNAEIVFPHYEKIYDFQFFHSLDKSKSIFVDQINLQGLQQEDSQLTLNIKSTKLFLNEHINPALPKPEYIQSALAFIAQHFKYSGTLFISSYSEGSRAEIKHLLELQSFSKDLLTRIHFLNEKFESGFYYETEKILLLTDGDLFSSKKTKVAKKQKIDLDLFAEQLSTLKVNDYVIHADHGVGIYQGMESLEIAGDKSDFLVLKFSEDDKVYVPVYKLNLIQKHADSHAGIKPDSLRTNKFQLVKARARISAKTLAFDLLRLQAERQSSEAYAYGPPDHLYREFELAFPFEETPDQAQAINDVLEAMQKPVPMDYLVCGDVGFGKTEVAMRAAFKAVEDKKQVAVLVPTTILALQHYNSFVKRYKDFPIKIEFISRFKTPKEAKLILERCERGDVDILIGTHKLLSDKLKFSDLGLVIVDEEQRFGVGHKEKLKLMKTSVDFLTLTATPIPRTMQMAFLGLRDLSLIKTAPPKRQSIKTYVIKHDDLTLQNAIRKELQRGGQVFVVHNKVQDIEDFSRYIKELVPEASIVFAHGQMNEKDLEDRINQFYEGKYQILIATTIIESGIDIPNANTMIIDRADTYGLAQLHQLRGRIGRSDKKAYAYFVVPYAREVSSIAQKRLHALQTYADMGAGFNIASVDLEIRGAGDILGASQSGHIEAVGLELYMELLKEAIYEIRGERKAIKKDIEIVTPFTSFIPNHYIPDAQERLKQYKRLSNCESHDNLETLKSEFEDIYGVFSDELSNLFTILETRIYLQSYGIKSIHVAGKSITLKFDKSFLENDPQLSESVVKYFISRPKIYQFTPDYRVIFNAKNTVSQSELIKFAKEIALNL